MSTRLSTVNTVPRLDRSPWKAFSNAWSIYTLCKRVTWDAKLVERAQGLRHQAKRFHEKSIANRRFGLERCGCFGPREQLMMEQPLEYAALPTEPRCDAIGRRETFSMPNTTLKCLFPTC